MASGVFTVRFSHCANTPRGTSIGGCLCSNTVRKASQPVYSEYSARHIAPYLLPNWAAVIVAIFDQYSSLEPKFSTERYDDNDDDDDDDDDADDDDDDDDDAPRNYSYHYVVCSI